MSRSATPLLGLDANWKTNESGFVTNLVDKLPFYATKQDQQHRCASMEAAYLIPGHSKAIGNAGHQLHR
jgi:hypothetical protein